MVEDEEKLRDNLIFGLSKKGYAVDGLREGDKALKRISLNHMDYDLVILDLNLPGVDGDHIAKTMRKDNITTPILILTARDETETKVDLLSFGADDYLVKPFSFEELLARMQALLRRQTNSSPSVFSAHEITLNSTEHQVTLRGKTVALTLKEFVLLEYFMQHPNIIIKREELLTYLWDFNYSSFSNVIDVHVKNLRKKLGFSNSDSLRILETVRGIGYRFVQ